MRAHSLKTVQRIPVTLGEAWSFFSNPANLAAITPAALSFRILSVHHGEVMYPGQLIEYRVAPVAGIPLYWMTEITHVEPNWFFVDEQRFGPYAFWHHQHHFREIEGGVEMTDIVHWKNRLGPVGRLVNGRIVRPRLRSIFEYRFDKIVERFGPWKDAAGFRAEMR